MWDMKPDAPKEIRGEFQPIATSLPGVQFSEHLPRLARHMHRCTLVRSVHHSVNNAHAAAVYTGLTGHDRGEIGGGAKPTDHPAIGSVMGLCRPPSKPVVPYVSMPYITQEGAGGPPQPGFFGGLLGRTRDPLFVLRNPDAPDFAMPELGLGADMSADRLDARRRLLDRLHGGVTRSFGSGDGRLPGQGVRSARLGGDAEGISARSGAAGRARPLWPQHLRPERAAGPSSDRGGHARGLHLVGAGRQRHLGHARQQLRQAENKTCCRSSTRRRRAC